MRRVYFKARRKAFGKKCFYHWKLGERRHMFNIFGIGLLISDFKLDEVE